MIKVSVLYKGIEYYLSDTDVYNLPPIYRLLISQMWKEKTATHICIKYDNYE